MFKTIDFFVTTCKKTFAVINIILTICFCHVTYAFQSESTRYSCLNVKELLAWSRREMWRWSDCNWTRTLNHLVLKWTLNHLRTKWFWVRVQLQSQHYLLCFYFLQPKQRLPRLNPHQINQFGILCQFYSQLFLTALRFYLFSLFKSPSFLSSSFNPLLKNLLSAE